MAFKITNTTRKQNPRNTREKVGHMIQVRPDGRLVAPNGFDTVETLTEAHLALRRVGHCVIEEITDAKATLKQIDEQVEIERRMAEERRRQQQADAQAKAAKVSKTGHENEAATLPEIKNAYDKQAMREAKRADEGIKPAAPVAQNEVPGAPTMEAKTPAAAAEAGDLDLDAINPDGEPNFVVQAKGRGQGRGRGRAAQAGQPATPV